MNTKADYVKRQAQTRRHHCHWPGCTAQVPPAMWGCRPHWYSLPLGLRNAIWRTYRPGQEITATPSRDYLAAARAVLAWISANHAPPVSQADSAPRPAAAAPAPAPPQADLF
jgi:hypothetical protein